MKLSRLERPGFAAAALSAALVLAWPGLLGAAEHEHHPPVASAANDQWEEAAVQVPDLPVVNQDGEPKRFFSDLVKGRTVAINFIYTSCSSMCSPLTAKLRRVQQDLQARGGDPIQFVSVSVDPATDRPAVLKDFSQRFGAGPGWDFVTGETADIERLLQAFGVPIVSKENHTPLIFVTKEPTGKWTRAYGLASAQSITATVAEVAGLPSAAAQPQSPVDHQDPVAPHAHHH